MTKQDFLDEKEFKTDLGSTFTYKYKYGSLMCKLGEGQYRFEASILKITDNEIIVFSGILGKIFEVNKKFFDLILV